MANNRHCVKMSTIDGNQCLLHENHVGACSFNNELTTVPGGVITTTDLQVKPDMVSHPPHYVGHPSGIECIEITRHMGFNLGNATKYIWRADLKNDAIEDLKKAIWYLQDEIAKREKQV